MRLLILFRQGRRAILLVDQEPSLHRSLKRNISGELKLQRIVKLGSNLKNQPRQAAAPEFCLQQFLYGERSVP